MRSKEYRNITMSIRVWIKKELKNVLVSVPLLCIEAKSPTLVESLSIVYDKVCEKTGVDYQLITIETISTSDAVLKLPFEQKTSGIIIKTLREKNNMSRRALCSKMGWKSKTNLLRYENGDVEPTPSQFSAIIQSINNDYIVVFDLVEKKTAL